MNRAVTPVYELFPSQKRLRVVLGAEIIVDTCQAMLLRQDMGPSQYYFPEKAIRAGVLNESGRTKVLPALGEAKLFDVAINGEQHRDAAWTVIRPEPEVDFLRGLVALDWGAMDGWFEEELEVFIHPRDPRKRVETALSSSHVQVLWEGMVVADTVRATFLFETGLPVRYYIPKLDVRLDLLQRSDTITYCPYKGEARYYSLKKDDKLETDVVWFYRIPLPEATGIATRLAFYQERVETRVDGKRV